MTTLFDLSLKIQCSGVVFTIFFFPSGDILEFYQTPVDKLTPLEHLKASDLPPNLNIQLEAKRFDPGIFEPKFVLVVIMIIHYHLLILLFSFSR